MGETVPINALHNRVDLAIITILQEEYEAVLERFSPRKTVDGGKQFYEYCRFRTETNTKCGVAVLRSLEQGATAAQSVARDVIDDLNPGWLLLTGIAGAVPDAKFSLGDVLLASRLHDFSVKAVIEGRSPEYEVTGGPMHRLVEKLLMALPGWRDRLGDWNSEESIGRAKPRVRVPKGLNDRLLYGSTKAKRHVRNMLAHHFSAEKCIRRPLFYIGSGATASVLVKDSKLLSQWQKSARHLTHIEMEAGGVYQAAKGRNVPLLCVRGISDVVGFRRSPEWRAYACHVAAAFVHALIRSGTLESFSLQQPVRPWVDKPSDPGYLTKAISDELEADDFYSHTSLELPRHAKYIIPHISCNYQPIELDTSIEDWVYRHSRKKPLMIISPPGAGKSLAVTRLKLAIAESKSFPSLILFMNLGIMDECKFRRWPWDMFRRHLSERIGLKPKKKQCLDALKRHVKDASVCLFLDGLDEYAVRHLDHVEALVHRCVAVAAKGVRVTLTCRSWVWNHQVRRFAEDGFDVLEIHEFDQSQAWQILGKKRDRLPSDAFEDPEKRTTLQKWMLNPQLLSFVRDSKFDFESKTDVFRNWARRIVETEKARASGRKLEEHKIFDFFGDLAVLATRARTNELKAEYWQTPRHEKRPYLCPEKQYLTPEEAFAFSLLVHRGSSESARFSHALVWEYFIAARLANDFNDVVREGGARDFFKLDLSTTALDFVPSSVYGFLAQTMGVNYEEKLLAFLNKPVEVLAKLPADLLRNLIEYLGKTSRGENTMAVENLLKLIESSCLNALVRYNAARALERVHPGAPRPYFDFASDWGGEDWKNEGEWRFDEERWKPWAIRGAYLETRQPGRSPRMDIDFSKARKCDPNLQRKVCRHLMRVLETSKERDLRINCSHALVRWYDFRDRRMDQRLDKLIKGIRQNETRENLDTWVKKAAWRLR